MSYLLDKKIKRNRLYKIAIGVILFIILFFFRSGIFNVLSSVGGNIFHPVWVLGNNLDGKLKSFGSYFAFKNSLYSQNQDLQGKLLFDEARMSNYDSVVVENASLKEILGRKDPKALMVLAAILSKPSQSPYDTLVVDAGTADGIKAGNTVFALGDVPIGHVSDVNQNSAKIILFSNPGETTEAVISGKADTSPGGNIFVELIGRGGGNFEMIIPKDLALPTGYQVVLPGINSYVVGIVQKVISDPRSPFTKALLTSPVNVQELRFVEVEK